MKITSTFIFSIKKTKNIYKMEQSIQETLPSQRKFKTTALTTKQL